MRFLLAVMMIVSGLLANDALNYFNAAPDNKVLCKAAQYTFKMVSQKNAVAVHIHDHDFFKLKDENLYLSVSGCSPLDGKRAGLIF